VFPGCVGATVRTTQQRWQKGNQNEKAAIKIHKKIAMLQRNNSAQKKSRDFLTLRKFFRVCGFDFLLI
jgi:hypothetical protein